jgi:diguanylate cyclase (GGDEF)-like protein/putative nucleotidyltransferase with HDIG domain
VYVSEIGRALKLSELEMQALLTASFLHDIGKLAVPEHIINKPGKLTQEEFEKIKIHPVVGADILERVRFPYPVVPIVRSHHEAWDGSGYPDGLKGEEIPIGARILTVVDCFDALASDRPYRRAMPTEQAMALIKSKAGTQFDPIVVSILEQRYVELEELARTQGGELAPLNTEIFVKRGEAPGAGFQKDDGGRSAERGDEAARACLNGTTSDEMLSAIAAASQEAQALFEMSQMLSGSLSGRETSAMMSMRLRRLIAFDGFAVYRKQGEGLLAEYMDGEGARCFSDSAIPLGEGLSGWVAQTGRPILNGNPKVETNYRGPRDGSKALGAALSLPLLDVSGEIFGALTIYGEAADCFSRDAMRILQAIEPKFSMALQNGLRRQDAESEATIDFVTQLANARQFFRGMEAELNSALLAGGKFAVIVCDLDAFREVNESQGHATGNLLLRSIAEGLRRGCGSTDSVGRTGGDEFVLLLSGVDAQSCAGKLESIEQAVRKACRELKNGVNVPVSLGAAFFPSEGERAEELLGLAGRRMYLNKRTARQAVEGSAERKPIEMARSA